MITGFNFDEFNILLRSLFTKDDVSIIPTVYNFDVYMLNRYISMVNPTFCKFINQVLNSYELVASIENKVDLYKMYKAVLPKMDNVRFCYIKRKTSRSENRKEVNNEDIIQYARLLEISAREIRQYLKEIDSLNQNS